jgi:hypothetical protein
MPRRTLASLLLGLCAHALSFDHTISACDGDSPIHWLSHEECKQRRARGAVCTNGDVNLALQDTAVAQCSKGFVYFNRSMTRRCFDQAARRRGNSSFRILFAGTSNMRHVWRAVGADDVFTDNVGEARSCSTFGQILRSFTPHGVVYQQWQVVSNSSKVQHKTDYSCVTRGSIGGPMLQWVTAAAQERFDVVVVHVGQWDASFTSRDGANFEVQLERGVQHVLTTWPGTRVLLVTMPPCGVRRPKSTPVTPAAACEWVHTVNAIIWRIVDRNPSVWLLDAYQMVVSHPMTNDTRPEAGFWSRFSSGWHLGEARSIGERNRARARDPPSAAGEMHRAIANRVLGMVCASPTLNMHLQTETEAQVDSSSAVPAGTEAVARGYLESVYRMRLPPSFDAAAFAASLEWLYRAPLPVSEHKRDPVPLKCKLRPKAWHPSNCRSVLNANRAGVGILFAPRLDRWGLRNPAGHAYRCDEQPHGGANASRAFVPDHTWMEVLRWKSLGHQEGAGVGCWWFAASGSGIFLQTGRSLRVHNRAELAVALGMNVSEYTQTTEGGFIVGRLAKGFPRVLATQDLRDAYFKKNPWVVEHRGGQSICPRAVERGYNTIQLRQEECSWPEGTPTHSFCYVEIISCHPACTSMGARQLDLACPPGLPLRTGLNASLKCQCSNARDMANCELTGNASLLTPPYKVPRSYETHPVRLAFDQLASCEVPRSGPATAASVPVAALSWESRTRVEGPGEKHGRNRSVTLAAIEAQNGPFRNAVGASREGGGFQEAFSLPEFSSMGLASTNP